MTPEKLYRVALQQVIAREAQPAHKFGHQPRLYALAQQIGLGLDYDDDVVFAAIWLHDIGVFESNRPIELVELQQWEHVEYAVRRAVPLLQRTDFPQPRIAHVLDVIRQHQPQDEPTSLEATLVRDADILEQLGAIAVLRTAAKLGGDTRFANFSDVSEHLHGRLKTLPALLQLPRARELALPRQRALELFLQSLDAEAGSHLN